MNTSLPIAALTGLGILITILGLFAAGSIPLTAVGLGAIAAAGMLELAGRRARYTEQPSRDQEVR